MMKSLRLLIVDDEPLIRSGVRSGLNSIAHLEVIGEAESGADAVHAILDLQPDLVLLDVQLQDMTGLEVVQQIPPERAPAVVFLTAYDEYAVRAFELNAIDYVLKPFDPERLAQSIERARERIASQTQSELAEKLQNLLDSRQQRWAERIVVKTGERYDIVPVDSLDWIESANNYVRLHCGAKEYLLNETLTSLENRLNPKKFLRVHRRHIVNLTKVLAVHPMFGGAYQMELHNGTRIGTGRQFKAPLESFLSNQKL
jgi:two-component system, LytTR family, response regulator